MHNMCIHQKCRKINSNSILGSIVMGMSGVRWFLPRKVYCSGVEGSQKTVFSYSCSRHFNAWLGNYCWALFKTYQSKQNNQPVLLGQPSSRILFLVKCKLHGESGPPHPT